MIKMSGVALIMGALVMPSLFAQDMDAMTKWTSLTIIHYRAVGEFSGTTRILTGENHHYWEAKATDRIEVEFDWNQFEMTLVGEPVIKNFPTVVTEIESRKGCPAPRIEGALEQATALRLRLDEGLRYSGVIPLQAQREQPAGAIPWGDQPAGEACGAVWIPAPAKSELTDPVPGFYGAPQAMMLAMPRGSSGMETTPDGKSMIFRSVEGWVWTFTPTPGD